jgi:hypothetical protein
MKFNSRDIKNRHFVFHIEQESSQPDVIFLQIYNDNRPSNLRFELLTEAEFIHKENLKAAFLGIYFGSFAFIMILILFLYIRSRNGVFLVYLIHIFFGNAFFLYYEGLVFKYLLPESGLVSDYLFVLLLAFAILSFQEFGRRLLKLDENLPLLNKTLIGLGIVIFCAIICVFISYETMVFLSLGMTYVAPFSILLLTVGSLQLFLQKPRSDLLIINLALFSWFMAAVVFIGKEFALLPGMFFTEEILKIAFFLEVIFLTLVLLKGVTVNINLKDRRIRYSSNIILSQKASIDEKEQELIKMNKLIDKSFNGMALLNQNMKITWFNKNFRYFHNLEEYTDEEIRSMRLDNIFHYEKVGDTINKCFLTNDNQDIESLVSKDGERYLWVKSTFSPLKDPDETVVLVVDADITELKDTQLELQKHNKGLEESNWFKTEVISNVSHDLASVLNTLTGFINLTKAEF